MIDIDDEAAASMFGGSFIMRTRVESWRGAELLSSDIPIDSGTETADVTLTVPETLTLTVPRVMDGAVWAPDADIDHPLAAWGQRLRVYTFLVSQSLSLVRRNWFYITDARPTGDGVQVQASGLLGKIAEASFSAPVTASGTFGSMLRQLIEPELTVDLTAAPTDRSVPAGMVWNDGRLDAVNELLTAWPARMYVDEDGIVNVIADADTTTSSLELSDEVAGTTAKWSGDVSRSGSANMVVARGFDSTGKDVQGVAFDDNPFSPTSYNGPFSSLPVPFIYFSPLLTTNSQCRDAAATVLARRQRQAARSLTVDAVPYLALQIRDGVTATASDLGIAAKFGVVDKLTMPLTAKDGAMTATVRFPL